MRTVATVADDHGALAMVVLPASTPTPTTSSRRATLCRDSPPPTAYPLRASSRRTIWTPRHHLHRRAPHHPRVLLGRPLPRDCVVARRHGLGPCRDIRGQRLGHQPSQWARCARHYSYWATPGDPLGDGSFRVPRHRQGELQVRKGDTLWSIARTYNTSVISLARANSIDNPSLIRIGAVLTVPAQGSTHTVATSANLATTAPETAVYVVRSGDTLSAIASRYGTTVDALARTNHLTNPSLIRIGQTLTVPRRRPTGLVGDTFLGRTLSRRASWRRRMSTRPRSTR